MKGSWNSYKTKKIRIRKRKRIKTDTQGSTCTPLGPIKWQMLFNLAWGRFSISFRFSLIKLLNGRNSIYILNEINEPLKLSNQKYKTQFEILSFIHFSKIQTWS